MMNLESLGKEPISQEQPTGMDVRFEPLFEELQAEVGKLSSLAGPASVDWGKIVKLSSEILGEKSKDLLAASYLTVALIYTRQIEGFAIGLKIIGDMLETFWDLLYPAKMKGRVSAIEWWAEKTEGALKQLKPAPISPELMKSFRENLEKIDQLLTQNFEKPPSLTSIQDQLKNLSSPPTPTEKPKEEIPAPVEKAVSPGAEIQETIASGKDAQRVFNAALRRISDAVSFLLKEDLSNPLPYRWSRIHAWSGVEGLPPSTEGRTKIPPPPAQIRTILSELREKGDDEGLIRSAETRLPQFIFWIDLNRFVSEGLFHLGEKYEKAKGVVHEETAFLIHRFSGLEDLTFSDGFPFADPDTKKWLKEIAFSPTLSSEGSPMISAPILPKEDKNPIEGGVEEAQALIKKGKLIEAIEGLQQKFQRSPSRREKLLWRLALSQLLIKNKQAKVALPHLEEILKEIDFYRLEEYDPELSLKGLKVIWMGFSSQSDQASKEKAHEVFQRIARLDLTEAIRIGKG